MKNQSISSTPSTSEVCVYKYKSWKLATKKTDCKGSSVTVQVYQITVTLQVVIQWLNRPLKNPKRLWQERAQSCNRETPNVGKPFGNFVAFLWKQLYNRVPSGRMLAGSPLAKLPQFACIVIFWIALSSQEISSAEKNVSTSYHR